MFTELEELVVLGRFAGGPAVILPTLTELRFLQFPIVSVADTRGQGWKKYFTFWDHKEKLKIFCK